METLRYLMWLHLKLNMLPLESAKLLSFFHTPLAVYEASKEDYMACGILNKNLLKVLMDKSLKAADLELCKAKKLGVKVLGYGTPGYPTILGEISDPPLIIYVKGDASILQNRNVFCIVGTRKSTVYGMSAALGFSEQLARCGMVIISGVAVGIDSGAHRGAIRANGKTIGVMGCGLDIAYPSGNEEVRNGIVSHGALISEFPFGTPPLPGNFPMRNRILSALSLGVAVIEAGERSGALITAKHAAEQGRDVYALPGNISSPMSAGTNALIRDGASLLLSAEDILAEYILRYPSYFDFDKEEKEPETDFVNVEKTLQNSSVSKDEKQILSHLGKNPKHINELARESGLDVSKVLSIITMLQIRGKVKEHPGNTYSV